MTLTSEILRRWKKGIETFVETGTYKGSGVRAALDAEFLHVYSIEYYEERFNDCRKKFEGDEKVILFKGNSPEVLKVMFTWMKERALFWLDAHYDACKPEPQYPKPLTETFPLLQELEVIKSHPIKNHTILIDDRRAFDGSKEVWHNIREEDIIVKLKEINSEYSISFIDSKIYPQDIIVAEIL